MRRRMLVVAVAASLSAVACARKDPSPPAPTVKPRAAGGVVGGLVGARPVRVGGEIREPRKLKDVRPVYPAEAREARIQGLVIVETTIDREGRVSDVHVLRGLPLLDKAAVDAVQQWEYTPTLLNGMPVEVIMTVTVNFALQ